MESELGISTILGGGISGFTDKTMRDSVSSNVGGLWNLRVTLGSHTPLGLDVGYTGTAANIDALIGNQSGTLVGTTAEGALRYNVLPHFAWNPYVFAGIGWQRYDGTCGNFHLSDTGMNESDNSVVYPMGLGMSYRHTSGLVLDLRGTFRANTNAGLVLENAGSSYAPMHTWEASAAAGYEF
jgi:opacity protein-like surface antigen